METKLTLEEIFDKEIQERVLNEDNPQYVLGWNACRYLARKFISQKITQLIKEIVPPERKYNKDLSKKYPDNYMWCEGYNYCLYDFKKKLKLKGIEI